METKEYIVVLKDGIDYDQFWTEIESHTVGLPHVPDRPVGIVNERVMFKRLCEYSLTDAEADLLKNDSRVESVEIPVRNLPNVSIVNNIVQNAAAVNMNFNKQTGNVSVTPADYTFPAKASINWGLIRHSNQANPYGINPAGYTGLTTAQNYNYVPNGTGVDVIINDTGIQVNHPEFTNALGQSRVVRVDWNSIAASLGIPRNPGPYGGMQGSWNTLSYSDTGNDIDGHGTHVAGIAVGKTYGWAKNANIISLFFSNTGQRAAEPLDTFEMMMRWHQTKGNRNPTIVNMSWGIDLRFPSPYNSDTNYYSLISGGSYRGNVILSGQSTTYYQQRGLIPMTPNGFPVQGPPVPRFPYTSVAYNVALSEMIDTGIVVVKAAGNNSFKMDKPNNQGGSGDYDNFVNILGVPLWYNRGPSPIDSRAIVVGALDTLTSSTGQDQKVPFSSTGPRVDVYAAGTYIMSAGPSQPNLGAPYFLNQPGQNFKELVSSGTSQAAPQVAGMAALYLQVRPVANIYSANNCSNVQSWITTNSTTNTFFQTGNATSYTNYLSLLGGEPRVAYQPLQGLGFANNGGWRPIANVYVKGSSSWEPVRAAYIKTISGWTQVF